MPDSLKKTEICKFAMNQKKNKILIGWQIFNLILQKFMITNNINIYYTNNNNIDFKFIGNKFNSIICMVVW